MTIATKAETSQLQPNIKQQKKKDFPLLASLQQHPLYHGSLQNDLWQGGVILAPKEREFLFYSDDALLKYREPGEFSLNSRYTQASDLWIDEKSLHLIRSITELHNESYQQLKYYAQEHSCYIEKEFYTFARNLSPIRGECCSLIDLHAELVDGVEVDLVLYSPITRELKFALVRHASSEELASTSLFPNLLDRVRSVLRERWRELIQHYSQSIDQLNLLLKLALPSPLSLRVECGVVLHGAHPQEMHRWIQQEFLSGTPVIKVHSLQTLQAQSLWDGL